MPIHSSLRLSRPNSAIFIKTVAFLVGFCLVLEFGLRLYYTFSHHPGPGIGSINGELNIKLPMLDRTIRQNGQINCIFLGSSMFDDAVNPAVFEEKYYNLSGKRISCFNFSLATLTAESAGLFRDILENRYHPDIIFYGISARDLSDDFGELARPLKNDPWVQYQMGKVTLSGWLLENSYAYRQYVSIYARLNPENNKFSLLLEQSLTDKGFFQLFQNKLSLDGQNNIPNYKVSEEDRQGLEKLLQGDGETRIVFVEAPVHPDFLGMYVNNRQEDYFNLFQTPVSNQINQAGQFMVLSVFPDKQIVDDAGWGDVKHLNPTGASIFSAWLAEEYWNLAQEEGMQDLIQ